MAMKNIDEIMSLSVETLAEKQFEALKLHTISILQSVQSKIHNNDFDGVMLMLDNSPAGDGYGCDNAYIRFYSGDIEETISQLKYLFNAKNKYADEMP